MGNADPSRKPHRLNSPESARGHQLFLLLSLSLNLALLLFLVFVCGRPAAKVAPVAPFKPDTTRESGGGMRTDSKGVAALGARASQWDQLASADLAVYAANLRAAGCPQKTVRDILLPLIEGKFAWAAEPVPGPTNFWASFSQRQAAGAARAEQESALEQQRDKTLKELLGFAWTFEGLKHAWEGESAFFLGFLDYERAEKLYCINDRFKKKFSRAERFNRKDRRLAIYQALRQEVGEVLSPAEFEETELRGIAMISHRRNPNIFKTGLSGSELRQLMVLRRDLCNPIQLALLERGGELFQEHYSASEQQFNTAARALLGDSGFMGYLQSCDSSIDRTLASAGKRALAPEPGAATVRHSPGGNCPGTGNSPMVRAPRRKASAPGGGAAKRQRANHGVVQLRNQQPADQNQPGLAPGDCKSMSSRLLSFSLCLNLVLLGLAGYLGGRSKFGGSAPPGTEQMTQTNIVTEVSAKLALAAAPAPGPLASLRWSDIESDDYVTYAANLRKAGCPEPILRRIIGADLDELYAQKVFGLVKEFHGDFWNIAAREDVREYIERTLEKQVKGLCKERDALLKRVVGEEAHEASSLQMASAPESRCIDFLPPAKQEQLRQLAERYEVMMQAVRQTELSPKEKEFKLAQLRQEMESDRAQILSPEELAEYKLRKSGAASDLEHLHGADFSETELRNVAKVTDDYNSRTDSEKETDTETLDQKLQTVLGPARFAEFNRARSASYRELYEVASAFGLPSDRAAEIFDLRIESEKQSDAIRADKIRPAEEKQALLDELQEQVEQAVVTKLGEGAYQSYKARNGRWINSLGRL